MAIYQYMHIHKNGIYGERLGEVQSGEVKIDLGWCKDDESNNGGAGSIGEPGSNLLVVLDHSGCLLFASVLPLRIQSWLVLLFSSLSW